jgi:hypothetical protein
MPLQVADVAMPATLGFIPVVTGDFSDQVFPPCGIGGDDDVADLKNLRKTRQDRRGVLMSSGFLSGINFSELLAKISLRLGEDWRHQFIPPDGDDTFGEVIDEIAPFACTNHPRVFAHWKIA